MRKLITILLASLLLVSLTACDMSEVEPSDNNVVSSQSETKNDETENKETESPETEQPSVEKTKHSNLDLFIAEYNKVAKTPILDPSEIDIQSDEYYRTEFRLNAYKNAPAYIANLGTVKIELINSNYEGMFGSDLRIYTTVDTLEAATDVFESFCKAGDTEITQADFDDFYQYHALDDGDVRPVIGDISGYIMVKDGKYEIMLDASPDYFDQD